MIQLYRFTAICSSVLLSAVALGQQVSRNPKLSAHTVLSAGTIDSKPNPQFPRYADPSLSTEERITALLSAMTLEEKIDAFGTNPTVPRLGIVGTGHVEGLHGLALGGPAGWQGKDQTVIPTTTFPQARGLGQTWDPRLLTRAASEEALETRYAFNKYHRGGLIVRAPNSDLSRDPRWGRSEESYGEDPYLVGTLAVAFAQGLQGENRYWMTASLLKHFLANSNEDGRGGSSSDFDARLFHEYYSVPFRMAIEQAHANAFMTSYNAWNGVPMTVNPILRSEVMRQWGFDGIICTDAGALTNLVTEHHAFKTPDEAVAAAVHAGINQFLDAYKPSLRDALKEHLLTETDLDQNLRGVFRVMIRLGMLDPTSEVPEARIGLENEIDTDPWMANESAELARLVTDESIVLLRNERSVLPLERDRLKSIAVIGPLADKVILDWYSGTPPYTVTPYAGIKAAAGPKITVMSDKGDDLSKSAALAARADVAIVIIGNHPYCDAGWMKCPTPSDGKEAVDRKSLTLEQENLVRAVSAVNPTTIVVLQASFPYTTTWTQQHVPAILEMAHNSQEQGNALADVLFGAYNPAGRLTQTWVTDQANLPAMMDYNIRHGKTYMYTTKKPLYAFGFGLSFTTFAYKSLALANAVLRNGQTQHVSFVVTNTGTRAGDEVAQLYVAHRGSTIERPVQELKGFLRIHLAAGESKTVEFDVAADSLRYWDESEGKFQLESDTVELKVGGSSDNLPLSALVRVTP